LQDTDLAEAVKKGKLTKEQLVSWSCADQGVWYAWRSALLLLVVVSGSGTQGMRMHAMLAFLHHFARIYGRRVGWLGIAWVAWVSVGYMGERE
jgi:hypothetical protein